MVGTPAEQVTFSFAMRSSRLSGSSFGPGKTSFAPTAAHECGRPHALAWNIGTTGITVSRAEIPFASVVAATSACNTLERWL
jgi:hypothetical protein